jgi:hypothetical protein
MERESYSDPEIAKISFRPAYDHCRDGVDRVPVNSPWFALCVFTIASMATRVRAENGLHALARRA